jgi:DNA-binding beta-propeller fold protein YncE
MIGIESKEVKTTISIDTVIYGMAVRCRTIYYCTGYNGLTILNLSDKSVSDIINSDMTEVYYVATSGDKLYYTKVFLHNVTCCDLHGTTQWEFNDKHALHTPCGIAIDNDGNVYVVGCRSNNVVVFPLMYNAIDNYCLPRML